MAKKTDPDRQGLHPYTWRWHTLDEARAWFFSSPLPWLSVIFTRRSDNSTGIRERLKHVHVANEVRECWHRLTVFNDWQKVLKEDLESVEKFDESQRTHRLNPMKQDKKTPLKCILAMAGTNVAEFARKHKFNLGALRYVDRSNNPTRKTLKRIAKGLKITTAELERLWSDHEARR